MILESFVIFQEQEGALELVSLILGRLDPMSRGQAGRGSFDLAQIVLPQSPREGSCSSILGKIGQLGFAL